MYAEGEQHTRKIMGRVRIVDMEKKAEIVPWTISRVAIVQFADPHCSE
jgi:hypothetical protein